MTEAKMTPSTIIPTLRYHDAAGAIEWLCTVLGFERHLVVPGENGTIAHAELSFGLGMIMLGSADNEGEFGRWVKPPSEAGGVASQGLYLIVNDVESHYARAVEQGAEVLLPLTDHDYGGSDYTCRDPEGFIWTFGTYDPWNPPAAAP